MVIFAFASIFYVGEKIEAPNAPAPLGRQLEHVQGVELVPIPVYLQTGLERQIEMTVNKQ